ncbi:ABC transporter ATP-binding protein [Laceyella putida]|uniref:ABC transporter ATP-binding protein n=1 Tax=Laceyella putida TaxID=110101 RepID=A0ABW2RLS6_9BACL
MRQAPVLSIRALSKTIGKRTIVNRVSFDVNPGEVFGLLGPNGAGKTTIIRMIVGLMAATEGEVFINGVSVQKRFEEAIQHVGAIVENPELYKFMSGYQNLLHFADMVEGVTPERIEDVISLVRLDGRIDDLVKTYSLGMRQRLGVAQAILHRPLLLILDEPTNGLDPAGIRELRDYLRTLSQEEGIAVLVSSHLLSEMELMCDRVAIIQHGQLIDVKSVGEWGPEQTDSISVEFEVDQPETVASVLGDLGWEQPWTTVPRGFAIELTREQIAELNAGLVKRGMKVYGIKALEKRLEDRFLEITGGETVG